MAIDLRATYRVQLRSGFDFDSAAALSDYLRDLGISHLYCSPYLQAAPGSTHGYDVVDPTKVDAELGGERGQERLVAALRQHGLGQLLDIVPNHMAIGGRENPWWWDVLENGPSSPYASYFDIDWDTPEAGGRVPILLPVLGDHYGRVLEAGELTLAREGAGFVACYFDNTFPLSPHSVGHLLRLAAQRNTSSELAFLADSFAELPPPTTHDRAQLRRRHRDKDVLRQQLARVLGDPSIAKTIDDVVATVNADIDALDTIFELQNYRLAFWRMARSDLGYRRFFDINTLVGLRMEDEHAFADAHGLVLQWLNSGVLDGVRVDHIDGLRDPYGYLCRLRQSAPQALILVEKILEAGEHLRSTWPIAGTTGYDFVANVGGLLIDPRGEAALSAIYAELTGEIEDYAELAHETKLLVLRDLLGSDVTRLAEICVRITERHRRHRDYGRDELAAALREIIACFPVYRTYVRPGDDIDADDTHYIDEAVDAATTRRDDLDPHLFEFLRQLLALRLPGELETELAMRFQQLTSPAMAKGVEDTLFYRFNRLVCLNEVGGDPSRFGCTVEEFHRGCLATQAHWPQMLLTTSTHDTKRSEDVRARLSLLSEIPERWRAAVQRWTSRCERHRRGDLPDRNIEYLFYQTLVGAWPIGVERVGPYLEKAAREAKSHTSWTAPVPEYDEGLQHFIATALADAEFVADVTEFVAPLIEPGRINGLALTLLKLTAPGVPDLYQGTELWDLSLVDPDNRRPVDYQLRRRLLRELDGMEPEQMWSRIDEGLPKLWVIRQALALRQERPALFGGDGSYEPIAAKGARADHVVAFARGGGAVSIAPRLPLVRGGDWQDTMIDLPRGTWSNQLTGDRGLTGTVPVGDLLARFPVALLALEE